MDYQFLAIVLLMLGFFLIVAEIFLPSGGLILVMCVIAFAASFWCAYKAWYGTSPIAFGVYLTALLVLIPVVVGGTFNIFPKTPMGKKLIGAPTTEEVTPYLAETAHLQSLIGRIGRTITPLVPGGMISLDGERLHAFSEGVLIDAGVDVEIMDARGTRVLVREAVDLPGHDGESDESLSPAPDADLVAKDDAAAPTHRPPLDFDVPQS